MAFIESLFGAIGSGLGLFGQSQAAEALEEAGKLNYELETENATVRRDMTLASLRTQRMAQRVGYLSGAINLHLDAQQAAAKRRNAKRIRELVEYNSRKDREGISRQSDQFDRLLSTQQSVVGMSGVTAEGAPMEVMTDTVEEFQHTLADLHDRMTFQRAAGLQEAVNLDFEGQWQEHLNQFNRRQFRRTRKLEGFSNRLARMSTRQQFRADLMQAEVNLLYSRAQAQAQQSQAIASGISGIGSALFGQGGIFSGF